MGTPEDITVHCYFLFPNKISLQKQTLMRLSNFIQNDADLKLKILNPNNVVIKISSTEQADDMVEAMNAIKKIEKNPIFLFLQDECHWGAGAGSAASTFTEKVLSVEGSYLIGVSATPNNQLKVLVDSLEIPGGNEIMDKIVKLESDQYFGRKKFIENEKNKKLFQCQTPATDIIIPMSYLCCIASHFHPDLSNYISYNLDKYNEVNLAEHHYITNQVIDQLFKGGLVVLPVSSTGTAKIFAESFGSILNERFPDNNILVCYSVSTTKEFVTPVNCNCTGLDFSNVLHHHEACLLVIVGRARFGDTFPENFKYFDLRDKFRAHRGITWTPFHQMCGRAFGYGERPTLILNDTAMKVFKDPKSACRSDAYLMKDKEKQKNKEQTSSNDSVPTNSTPKSSSLSDYSIEKNPIEEYSNKSKSEVQSILKSNLKKYIILTKENIKDYLGEKPSTSDVDIFFTNENQYYKVNSVRKDYVTRDNCQSVEEVLNQFSDDDETEVDLLELELMKLSKSHAGNNENFVSTFRNRFYLVAEPQMGKTGVMLHLLKLIAENYKLYSIPPGYPNVFDILDMCKHVKRAGHQTFAPGKYGKISLFEGNNIPACYENNNVSSSRTTIIQRVDKMNYTSSNDSSDDSQKWTGNIPGFVPIDGNELIFCSKDLLKKNNWSEQKPPFIFVTSGRADHPKININWIPRDSERNSEGDSKPNRTQIIVTTVGDYESYRKKFGATHHFVIVNETKLNVNVGLQRNCAILFAKHVGMKDIWLLDDNLSNKVELRTLENNEQQDNDEIISEKTLLDVVNYLEDSRWTDSSFYALRSPGKSKKYKQNSNTIKNEFSCNSGKGMSLVNVEKLANINYLPIEVAEDLEVAFHLIMNGELVCRFEIFGVSKIQMNRGGCSNYIGQYETFPDDDDEWDEGCLNIDLLDKLLPKCPENTGIKPIVALYTPDTKCSKEIINSLNKGRKTHVFDLLSSKIETCKSIKNNKMDFCGAFIETEHFFEALIYLNLMLFKENGEQNERDEDKLRRFLLGVAEQMIERDTRLTKLRKEFNDNYSVKNLFQSVSTQFL